MLNSNRLANVVIVSTNNHHSNSNNSISTNKHVLHKHSQSLDATGPYIPISECHTGESFIQKQISSKPLSMSTLGQKNRSLKLNLYEQQCPSSLTHTVAYQQMDNHFMPLQNSKNQKIFLHGRSNSNIVLGSKQQQSQYGHSSQQSNQNLNTHFHHFHQSQKISNNSLPQFNISIPHDVPTNRHFKVYEKIHSTREVSNSTSLLDVSCLEKTKNCCNLDLNLKKSDPKFCETDSLSHALSELNVNNQLKNGNSDKPPPRPPKPLNLRTATFNQSNSLNNNNSFNECFNNNTLISDEEFSPSFKDNLYPQSSNQLNHTKPKNSISSSCSSNASPFCTYGNNQQDLVFIYDQPLSYHSSTNFNFCDTSESYDNTTNMNLQYNQYQFNNNKAFQKNSTLNTSFIEPPVVDRNLKPRKSTINNKLFTRNNSKSQVQDLSSFYMPNFACETEEINLNDEKLCLDEFYYKVENDTAIQYLDLDLENSNNNTNFHSVSMKEDTKENQQNQLNFSSHSNEYKEASTVYKTVDFIKTNAFNKLRNNIENRKL